MRKQPGIIKDTKDEAELARVLLKLHENRDCFEEGQHFDTSIGKTATDGPTSPCDGPADGAVDWLHRQLLVDLTGSPHPGVLAQVAKYAKNPGEAWLEAIVSIAKTIHR